LFPSIAGVFVAWYFVNSIKRSTNVAIRIMIMTGALSIVQFADIYAKAIGAVGFSVDRALLPNLVFAIAIIIYIVLKYDPSSEESLRHAATLLGSSAKPPEGNPGRTGRPSSPGNHSRRHVGGEGG